MANDITPVNHAAPAAVKDVQAQAAPQQAAPANQKAARPQPAVKAPAPKDTVQISTAAQTALQESRETSTQRRHGKQAVETARRHACWRKKLWQRRAN